jgi:hypothetical protein
MMLEEKRMKKNSISQAVALIIGCLALATIIGCGGGGGGGPLPATTPSITTASLPAGVRGQLYSVVLEAAGGTTPYGWSATGLPPGISLDAATGVLSGTPTTDNSYAPTFTVTDNGGLTDSKSIPIVIQPLPSPSVSTASLPSGVRTQPYSASLSATSGAPPYAWNATGLPTGITLSAAGALTGTPTVQGTFTPNFTVTDNNGLTGSRLLQIVITSPPSPIVATAALPSGIQDQLYSASLSAASGTPPYTWSVTAGSLPTGVALSAAGALTGTPTATGTFNMTFTVTDVNGLTGSKPLSILINAPGSPVITTTSLPVGARTEPYSASLSATSGTPPYAWSAAGLPAGIALSAAGALTGTPSVEGTFTPVFTVTDSATMQAVKSLDLRIAKPLVLFVADFSTPSGAVDMFDNASVANGASAWTRQLKGTLTTLDSAVGGPPAGVAYDAARKILYAARFQGSDNGAVLAFNNADAVDGNAEPNRIIRTIAPTTFSLKSPSDVFIDSGNDRLYIADVTGSSGIIIILDSASATPTFRKIFSFTLGPPAAISVDIGRDILYVVPSQGSKIIAYDNISNLSSGQRTITIGSTAGVGLVDVKIDPATDTAYVADYDGGRVLVINSVSQKSGTYTPDRTLTGLTNPNSVFPDVANDRLFVSNRDGATSYSVRVVENISSADGPVSFSRQLSGFGTAAGMTGYYK